MNLLSEIIFNPDLSDHVQLRFEEVDVMFLIRQNFHQQFARTVVRYFAQRADARD